MEKNEKNNLINNSQINISDNNLNNEITKTRINKSSEKNRYYIFDNFKGILIFMVVFAHFLFEYSKNHINSLSRKIVVFIYYFHMQAFVFISGFFSSENSTMIKSALKLLILYYIFNFSLSLILYLYTNTQINFLYPYYSYWYILALFFWRITIKNINKIPFIFVISIIISLLEGYWNNFSNVLSIYKILVFYPYFIAGYKFTKLNIIDKLLLWKKGIIKTIIFIVIFTLFSYLVILYICKNEITNEILLLAIYNKTNNL